MKRRVAEARVARLATADPAGKPHVVPITFAVDGDTLYFAVDAKPKRTNDLKRLRNIAANPAVSVLVDHYAENWTRLWWVRVDGAARMLADDAESRRAMEMLTSKYEQYRRKRPPGPVVAVAMKRISGWSSEDMLSPRRHPARQGRKPRSPLDGRPAVHGPRGALRRPDT